MLWFSHSGVPYLMTLSGDVGRLKFYYRQCAMQEVLLVKKKFFKVGCRTENVATHCQIFFAAKNHQIHTLIFCYESENMGLYTRSHT